MGHYDEDDNEGKKKRFITIDYYDVSAKFMECVKNGRPWTEVGPYKSGAHQPMASKLAGYSRNKDSDKDSDEDYYDRSRTCEGCKGTGKDTDDDGENYGACPYCRGRGKTSWEGARPNDTIEWIEEGFRAREFTHAAEYVPKHDKRRAFWNEDEGEVDLGRLYGGFDDFFMDSQIRPSRPGMRLQIEYSFSWDTSPHILAQYGAWCAGFIRSLEMSGYDLVVDMWIHLDDLYQGDYGQRTNLLVRVKRENEVSNFTEWSALFSPSGYRHLGFTAKCVAGDKIKKAAVSSLGTCIMGHTWDVKYDRAQSTVLVTAAQVSRNSNNPYKELNKAAIREGLLPGSVEDE